MRVLRAVTGGLSLMRVLRIVTGRMSLCVFCALLQADCP